MAPYSSTIVRIHHQFYRSSVRRVNDYSNSACHGPNNLREASCTFNTPWLESRRSEYNLSVPRLQLWNSCNQKKVNQLKRQILSWTITYMSTFLKMWRKRPTKEKIHPKHFSFRSFLEFNSRKQTKQKNWKWAHLKP